MACDADNNFWDPYCPCRVTRKNIVMTFLGIVSLGLVVWTVIMTGQGEGLLGEKGNVTYVYVDDSKLIENVNITMSTTKTAKLATAANEKKVKAINDAKDRAEMKQQVKLKYIEDENNDMLCQCLCNLNVTIDEVLTALEYMKTIRPIKVVTTTAPPVVDEEEKVNDPYDWA